MTALAGMFLLAPPILGSALAQTEAERATVEGAIGKPQADALLTVWGAVNDLADAWAKGQFEADRASELAASYHASAKQVGALAMQAMRANPDAAPVVSGAGSLIRQAGLLIDWIAMGERSPPAAYMAAKATTDALMLNRPTTASAPAGAETTPDQQVVQTQEVQMRIVTSRNPNGAPGSVGTMTVVHTSDSAPHQVTWTYEDGTSDEGLGVALPGTGAIAVSFGTGAKSIHIYRLREPGGDRRSVKGLWAPALAGAPITPVRLTPKDGVLRARSFHVEGGGTLTMDRISSSSAIQVKWTFPTGEVRGIGVLFGTYLAAIAIDPEDRGGVALYYMMGKGPHAISRRAVNGSAGVGKQELVMTQPAHASAMIDPAPASDLEAEVRTVAEALRQDIGNATRWRPTTSQINSISATKADADKLRAYVRVVYADLLPGKPGAREGQTEILIRGPDLSELAGGYRNKKRHFRPGIEIYGFKFVEPGNDTGMLYDGLIRVNGEWIFIPKAWRAFQ